MWFPLSNDGCVVYSAVSVKYLKIWTPKNCCNYPKILTRWLYHRVMYPKEADGVANSVDPDQTAPLDVHLVCPGLSVRKLRIITVCTVYFLLYGENFIL